MPADLFLGPNDFHFEWTKIIVPSLSVSSIELWSSIGGFEAMVKLLWFRRPCGMVDRAASCRIVGVERHCLDAGMRQWFICVGLGELGAGVNDSSR